LASSRDAVLANGVEPGPADGLVASAGTVSGAGEDCS